MKDYFVYILSNKHDNVLYVGVTNDLYRRLGEHKNKVFPQSFTAQYYVDKLVYYEVFDDVYLALVREKQLKNWHRKWKIDLIESVNKNWDDLSKELFDQGEG